MPLFKRKSGTMSNSWFHFTKTKAPASPGPFSDRKSWAGEMPPPSSLSPPPRSPLSNGRAAANGESPQRHASRDDSVGSVCHKRPKCLLLNSELMKELSDPGNVQSESPMRTSSRLSKTLLEILHDKEALPSFICFMEAQGAGQYVRFWLDAKSFQTAAWTRIRTHSLNALARSSLSEAPRHVRSSPSSVSSCSSSDVFLEAEAPTAAATAATTAAAAASDTSPISMTTAPLNTAVTGLFPGGGGGGSSSSSSGGSGGSSNGSSSSSSGGSSGSGSSSRSPKELWSPSSTHAHSHPQSHPHPAHDNPSNRVPPSSLPLSCPATPALPVESPPPPLTTTTPPPPPPSSSSSSAATTTATTAKTTVTAVSSSSSSSSPSYSSPCGAGPPTATEEGGLPGYYCAGGGGGGGGGGHGRTLTSDDHPHHNHDELPSPPRPATTASSPPPPHRICSDTAHPPFTAATATAATAAGEGGGGGGEARDSCWSPTLRSSCDLGGEGRDDRATTTTTTTTTNTSATTTSTTTTATTTTTTATHASGDRQASKLGTKLLSSIEKDAVTIYAKYISLDASHSINISDALRTATTSKICLEVGKVDPECFVDCQDYVLEVMNRDYYHSYLHSVYHCKHQIDVLTSGKVYLADILHNDTAIFYFMEFMEQEEAVPLFQFWMAAENFQQHLSLALGCYDGLQAQDDAMVLYDKYFSLQATEPLGFEDVIRLEVESNICREGGPLPDCFARPKNLILRIIEKVYFPSFLQGDLYYKYLSELINTVQLTHDLPQKVRRRLGSDASSEHSAGSQSTGAESISSRNTLLAAADSSSSSHLRKALNKIHVDMTIDTVLLNPDALWKRNNPGKMSFGRINDLGQFVSEYDPEPEHDRKKGSVFFRKRKDREKEQEDMAVQIAQMIIKDVTSITQGSPPPPPHSCSTTTTTTHQQHRTT
ncbi:hypothetical protein Ahia01_001080400 [Argonauta hians]